MFKKIIIFCLSIFAIIANYLFSQTLGEVYNNKDLQPEVWHFTGPKETNVDARGDVSLEIPLMTVPGRGLSFPLNAHYRAGIQIDQSASWIGLGWSLDVGSITRNVQGGVFGDPQVDFSKPVDQIQSQPDIYMVNMPGGSTTLYPINANPYRTIYNIPSYPRYFMPVPWKPWKIGCSQ